MPPRNITYTSTSTLWLSDCGWSNNRRKIYFNYLWYVHHVKTERRAMVGLYKTMALVNKGNLLTKAKG